MVENKWIEEPPIGRVLRASTSGFVIGCQVQQLSGPSFGCLVKAQPVDEREAIFGLIYNMDVADDPLVRRLILADSPREEVISDQRQNRLLPIEMNVLAVGYEQLVDRHTHVGRAQDKPQIAEPVGEAGEFGRVVAKVDRVEVQRRPRRQAVVEAPVEAVADRQHAHLNRQQPVLTLVVDDLLARAFGQDNPPHQRVVGHVHVVDEAEDGLAVVHRLGLHQAAE